MFSILTEYTLDSLRDAAEHVAGSATLLLGASMSARAMHAHFLNIASARRKRAGERRASERVADAEFWRRAAPAALARAIQLRRGNRLCRLP